MSPGISGVLDYVDGLPRTRGDEPPTLGRTTIEQLSAPHTRG